MLSKSIQSVVGILVGFAIGGVLGLIATPTPLAPSVPDEGLAVAVERMRAEPVTVAVRMPMAPTTRTPRDDSVLPLPPVSDKRPEPPPESKPIKTTAVAPTRTVSTQNSAPKSKASSKPSPKPSPPAPAPTPEATPPPPDPVDAAPAPTPTPDPGAGKQKQPKPGKPDKPPKPPKPPKLV